MAVAVAAGVMLTVEINAPDPPELITGRTPGSVILLSADERGPQPFTDSVAVDLGLDPLLVASRPLTAAGIESPHRRHSLADDLLSGDLGWALSAGSEPGHAVSVSQIRRVTDAAGVEVTHLIDVAGDGYDDDGRFTVRATDGSAACVEIGVERRLARALGAPIDADGMGSSGISWSAQGPCGSAARPGAVADIRVGTTAGTFGGSADGDVCDVDRLIDHVTADPSLARAFGAPFAVAATGASALIRELTPVVLLTDTAVTEYALRGDGVGSRQAILQRGTAVLVDAAGMPAVRCISGSPVRAPQTLPPDVVIEGEAWDGFDLSRVSRTPPGDRLVDRLVLVDVRTGLPVIRPIGADGRTGILAGSILASAG